MNGIDIFSSVICEFIYGHRRGRISLFGHGRGKRVKKTVREKRGERGRDTE